MAYGGAGQCTEAQEQQIPPAMIQHGHPSSTMLAARGDETRFISHFQSSPHAADRLTPLVTEQTTHEPHVGQLHAYTNSPSLFHDSRPRWCWHQCAWEAPQDSSAALALSYQALSQPGHDNMRLNQKFRVYLGTTAPITNMAIFDRGLNHFWAQTFDCNCSREV